MKNIGLLLLLITVFQAQAQTGIGTVTPDPSAVLDLSMANKGLLLPRVALTGAGSWSLTGATPTDGMLIFNTAYAGTGANVVAPGLYYWKGNQWFSVSQSVGPLYSGTATSPCNQTGGVLSPQTTTFVNGQSYTGKITATYTNGNGGTYPGDVVTINGITLTRTGGVLNGGNGQLVYNASGIWNGATGTYASFPMNILANYCNVTLPMPAATYGANSISCTLAPTGAYQIGTPVTAANTKTVEITVAAPGSYLINTPVVNGIVFTGSGAAISGFQGITLTATGTPTAAGTFTHSVTLGGQTCAFQITYDPASQTDCSELVQNTPNNTLIGNTSYSGTVVWSYSNGNGVTTIPAASVTLNGLTLSHGATTTASGNGTVTYNLSGVYTGATGGVVSFPISLNGVSCHAVYGDNIRNALNAGGCASCGAYDAAATNSWIIVTQAEYAQLSGKISGVAIAGAATLANVSSPYGFYSNITGATNTPANARIPAQSYIAGFSVVNVSNGLFAGYTRVSPSVKYSSSLASGYSVYGSVLPNEFVAFTPSPFISYFVNKAPTNFTLLQSCYLGYYDGGGMAPLESNETGYNTMTGSGNTPSLPTAMTAQYRIQAITTQTKQW